MQKIITVKHFSTNCQGTEVIIIKTCFLSKRDQQQFAIHPHSAKCFPLS